MVTPGYKSNYNIFVLAEFILIEKPDKKERFRLLRQIKSKGTSVLPFNIRRLHGTFCL